MAEEIAPWLVQSNGAEEIAPWLKESEVGHVEDTLRTIGPAAARGVMSVAGTPGDLQGLVKLADDKGYNPLGWLSDKIGNTNIGQFLKAETEKTLSKPLSSGLSSSGDMMGGGNIELPSSAKIKKAVEENVTGKLYEPKRGVAKAVGTGLEIAPSLAMGPVGGLRGLAAKSAGAGVTSELAGEGAEATKHLLPESAQPWAEPVARAVGALAGTFTPAGVRKTVTPLPMADEQFNVVQALKKSDPAFVNEATAGQLTQSPKLMGVESRALPDQAERQGKAFTAATESRGADTGAQIGQIYKNNSINATEFSQLNTDVAQAKRQLGGITGTKVANDVLGEIQKEIKLGAANSPNVLNMPGPRYQYLRGQVQGAIDGATNSTVKQALIDTKKALDGAFERSLSNPSELATLKQQNRTYKELAGRKPTLDNQMTPASVLSAAAKNEGNAAVNTGKSPLANWARDADKVMTPLPKVSDKTPPWFDLSASAIGALMGAGGNRIAGGGLPLHGAEVGVFSHLLAPSLYQAGAKQASNIATSAPAQKFLGNQAWRPGAGTTAPSKEELIRLLMSPEARQQ